MSKKFKFVLNREGVRQLLNGNAMSSELSRLGENVRERAGEGYKLSLVQSSDRKKAIVEVDTPKAFYDNLRNNTLLKALK